MFNNFKNPKQIERLKTEILNNGNDQKLLNSFTGEMTLFAVDDLITKLNELQNIHKVWNNEIKVKRLNVLKKELEFLTLEIDEEKKSLKKEREKLKSVNLKDSDENNENIYLYDMAKKWCVNSIKMLDKMNRRFDELSREYTLLKNDNELFAFDSKGRPIAKTSEVQNILQSITLHISSNLQLNINSEKLKKLISNEEVLEDDF